MNLMPWLVLLLVVVLPLSSCDKLKASWLITRGNTAYNNGNMDGAIALYEEALRINPDFVDIHWSLGTAYYGKGDTFNVEKQIFILKKNGKKDLAENLQKLLDDVSQ